VNLVGFPIAAVKLITIHNLALLHENMYDGGSEAPRINLGLPWM